MINPSANGWIDKFFQEQQYKNSYQEQPIALYNAIRKTGFIYGHVVSVHYTPEIYTSNLKTDELSKLALLSTLFEIYVFTTKAINKEAFVKLACSFYESISPKGFNLLNKIAPPEATENLEILLNTRIQTNKDSISKSFSHIITNALLFIDVLAFQKYLIDAENPTKFLKKTEEVIINTALMSLRIKQNKSQHDDLLIKLFEASVRYTKFSKFVELEKNSSIESLELNTIADQFYKMYLLDITAMTLWSDGKMESDEMYFLETIALNLGLDVDVAAKSNLEIDQFIKTYKNEISYLNYSNPVKHFYDNTSDSVGHLISRNKIRLIKELQQSKELVLLLRQSTHRDLEPAEKKKVKKQLLDIFKTIPSFAIFMLPGGSLLLPICIRFIPQLLPSAFNENLEE